MIILVSDTSILIDLHRGGLLETAFACGFTMVVPDILYDRELEAENGPYLKALGLGVVSLTPDEVAYAQAFKNECKELSLPGCFALSCASRASHVLLTGDGALRTAALARDTSVHGLLWLLDEMEASGAVPQVTLHAGLTQITANRRCRLPHAEVRARLALWQAS